jgi:dTDP-glucose 4,6-dehydratase
MTSHEPRNLLVTGGAGFIGANFVRMTLERHPATRVVNLDLLAYAGNLDNLEDLPGPPRHVFVKGDIGDAELVASLLREYEIDSIVHFAAESHVDRSIAGPAAFVETNVRGTFTLLRCALAHPALRRFLQVGTDEVYGALTLETSERFTERSPLSPRSPYSASKAAADHLCLAWYHTYGLPAIVTRCSNNYGPRQFPEKLIPLMIHNAMRDTPLPVYGDGLYVRDWIYVEDHCAALWTVLTAGRAGEVYNIGSDQERPNLQVVRTILDQLGKPHSLIRHVEDRLGHDRRYAIDASKIRNELGWTPSVNFETGIRRTIQWYTENKRWLDRVASGAYRSERGLGAPGA